MNKVLIIDDDKDIGIMLSVYLEKENYIVEIARDGEEGLRKFETFNPNILLIDILMPKINGYDVLSRIRKVSDIPVIMLTAKGQQADKVLGFIKGCDDYLVKPIDLTELSFRIKAILKRINNKNTKSNDIDTIYLKDLEISLKDFTIIKGDKKIKLTKKEFEILVLLAKNKGKVFSPKAIYQSVWNQPYIENDNSVLTHIRNIREKIGDNVKESKYIKTTWGVGYSIEKDI
ncbi:response regulator transcription factor [uncultured Clostridium sp.]|uniref:response regulator transcription factor n=1 Tax=uncultured Clostridium sp. TaxID=59620 RepID=UPI0025ECD3B2|nr:response regulator transcription factor [uncultured Clostridium sp.]